MHKFAALVEKAVSYSSASMTKRGAAQGPVPGADAWRRPGAQKHQNQRHATTRNPAPDLRTPESRPAWRWWLPCVPATASTWRPCKTCSASPLRPAGIGTAGVQDGFHQGNFGFAIGQPGAADHIAHHKHIGLQRHLVGAIASDQFDAERAQLVAHGR